MKPAHRFMIPGLAAVVLSLAGCGGEMYPPYSAEVQYGVRQDPIRKGLAKDLGDERYDPDRPSEFPIMSMDAINKPDNPLFAKRDDIVKKETLRDPTKISSKDRDELEKALVAAFGTPANPTVNAKLAGIDPKVIEDLKLDDDTLAKGSKRYRVHCLHCHGVPGDGRGPTARWINPHPRDFRAGLFKFQSVNQSDGNERKPARADLLRTLQHGLEGTAMPSFRLLEDQELEYLVSYVIHLSLRGWAELSVITSDFQNKDGALIWNNDEAGPADRVNLFAKIGTKRWKEGQDPANAIKVVPYPFDTKDMEELAKSVQRGQQLFTGSPQHPRGKSANCVSCHIDYGRQAKFRFDDWATLVRPNNFTLGVFRGGHRPVDMYYRIHSGINGSGMTNFGKVLEGPDIWDLVNFVSNLSYPTMRQALKININ